MRLLIDTHIAIWAIMNSEDLPQRARDLLMDEENEIFYSAASVWEVVIKHMIRPNNMIMDGRLFEKGCESNGYHAVPILNKHAFLKRHVVTGFLTYIFYIGIFPEMLTLLRKIFLTLERYSFLKRFLLHRHRCMPGFHIKCAFRHAAGFGRLSQ